MTDSHAADRKNWIHASISPAIKRTLDELAATRREFNRSRLVRTAIVEMADRVLPSNWRETVGLDESDEAAA